MNIEDAIRTVAENRGSQVVKAMIVIFEDELEKCKKSLLQAEGPEIRGKGQLCVSMINDLERGFHTEESVDNQE